MAPSRVWVPERKMRSFGGAQQCRVDRPRGQFLSTEKDKWAGARVLGEETTSLRVSWSRKGIMSEYRTGQANPVAVILPRVEWQAAYVTDYSRYDNDTPDANAIRREATAEDQHQRRRRECRRRDGADRNNNTPTRILVVSLSLIPVPWTDVAECRDAPDHPQPPPRGHLDRVRIMTAAVVMENVNWDPGKCE